MNVYDFDKTIYDGDSTVHFVLFCLKKQPSLICYLPTIVGNALLMALKLRTKTKAKQQFYRFFRDINDIDAYIAEFWRKHLSGIKPWYKELQREDDLVISASPLFLVEPACREIGITQVMASDVDQRTGLYAGLNCHGEEKVRRFYARYPGGRIEEFYSDSLSDTPLARIAEHSFLVKGNDLMPWPEN